MFILSNYSETLIKSQQIYEVIIILNFYKLNLNNILSILTK